MSTHVNRELQAAWIQAGTTALGVAGIIATLTIGQCNATSAIAGVISRVDEVNVRVDETNMRVDETSARADEVGVRIDGTNERIDQTNERLDQTNERLEAGLTSVHERLDQTNERIDQTNERLDQTNARLDRTNARLDEVLENRPRPPLPAESPHAMVPRVGLEPTRPVRATGILSPVRLPVSPPRHGRGLPRRVKCSVTTGEARAYPLR